jgi:hypothetical protein
MAKQIEAMRFLAHDEVWGVGGRGFASQSWQHKTASLFGGILLLI